MKARLWLIRLLLVVGVLWLPTGCSQDESVAPTAASSDETPERPWQKEDLGHSERRRLKKEWKQEKQQERTAPQQQ